MQEHVGKIKFDFAFFTLYVTYTPDGSGKIAFSVKSKDLKGVHATAAEWLEFYRFLDAVSSRKLEIRVRRIGSDGPPLAGSVGAEPSIGNTFQTGRAVGILTLLNRVMNDCGLASAVLTPDDVNGIEHMLDCIAQAAGRTRPPFLNLEVDTLDAPLVAPRFVMLFTFRFMGQLLTIFVEAVRVDHVAGPGRDLFRLKAVKYLNSEVSDDYCEVESMSSALADELVDREVLMLPQGDVDEVRR